MLSVKICGLTRLEDALAAIEAGVDMLGFNFTRPARVVSQWIRVCGLYPLWRTMWPKGVRAPWGCS